MSLITYFCINNFEEVENSYFGGGLDIFDLNLILKKQGSGVLEINFYQLSLLVV